MGNRQGIKYRLICLRGEFPKPAAVTVCYKMGPEDFCLRRRWPETPLSGPDRNLPVTFERDRKDFLKDALDGITLSGGGTR